MIKYDNQTKLLFSASANPGSFGTRFYNYFFNKYSINAVYLSRAVTDAEMLTKTLRFLNVYACSVSMPLKQHIVPFLDEITPTAQRTQAVNSVRQTESKLVGENTDYGGFVELIKSQKSSLNNVVVYGYGGLAQTIILAMRDLYPACRLSVASRSQTLANPFLKRLDVPLWSGQGAVDILINATPSDDVSAFDNLLKVSEHLMDFKMTGAPTRLETAAQQRGMKVTNGFALFHQQFIKQFQFYFDIQPSGADFKAAMAALADA
jgi:shikimate dehydrogenase